MAWQLIYTSAPRLLDAGLTGFGTVARHRAIPALVVKAVERISQFARQPGYDPSRIICAHRILTVAGSRYHVLSRLRDAGSDYSGRTNHVAHHVIATAAEAASSGITATPADVLWRMAWMDRWEGGPEWLESGQEVALGSFVPVPEAERAWEAARAAPDHRWLLVNGPASQGSCIIYPPTVDLLPLLAASQHGQTIAQAWQSAFTTALQPGDELSDFRWLGVVSNSPIRNLLATTGRTSLDLTAPDSLPTPEVPRQAVPAPTSRGRSTAQPAPAPLGKYEPPAPRPAGRPPDPIPGFKRQPTASRSPEPVPARPWLKPVLITIVIAAGGVTWFAFRGSPRADQPGTVAPSQHIPSLVFQQAIVNAKTARELRDVAVPAEDAGSPLADYLKSVKEDGAPADVRSALTRLQELSKDKPAGNANTSQPLQRITVLLEQEVLALCEKTKPDASKVPDYAWSDAGRKAKFMAWLTSPASNPSVAQIPPPVPSTKPEPPPPVPPTPSPPQARAPKHISVIKDWDSIEKVPVKPEWLQTLTYSSADGKLVTLTAQEGKFRPEKIEIAKARFEVKHDRLDVDRERTDYRHVDLISSGGAVWRIYAAKNLKNPAPESRPDAQTLKAAEALTWQREKGIFTLTEDAERFLKPYKLTAGQFFVLECPFTVDGETGKLLKIVEHKTATIPGEWLEIQHKAAEAKVEDLPKYGEIKTKIEEKEKERDFRISKVDAKNAKKKEELENIRGDFEKDVKPLNEEMEALRKKFKEDTPARIAHPLAANQDSKLPGPGTYKISLVLSDVDVSKVKLSEIKASALLTLIVLTPE